MPHSNDLFASEQKILDDAMSRIEAIRGGAPFDIEEFVAFTAEYGKLLKQLRRATRMADKTSAGLHVSNISLTGKVHYDALTGIYNRRFLDAQMERMIPALSRCRSALTMMMLDIDFFKRYNDTYGHQAGDHCLRMVADTISKCVTRDEDFAARYGGEEFTIVLPHTEESGARVIADKILDCVIARQILHAKNDAAPCLTVSIGVTTINNVLHTHKAEEYLKRADEALYLSKKNGRNRYTFLSYEG